MIRRPAPYQARPRQVAAEGPREALSAVALVPAEVARAGGGGAAPAVPAAPGARAADAPFVFHDVTGRRWSRIKRVTLAATAALVTAGAAVLLAVTHVAPGRAPLFSAIAPQQVPDWAQRGPGGGPAPAPAGPRRVAGAATARPSPGPAAAMTPSPKPSVRPTPSPSPTRTPRPRRSRPPSPAAF